MSPSHAEVSLHVIITYLALTVVLFSPAALHAAQAEIMRDGSLVFEQADDRSAVLDILPRGTRVELVERGKQWSQIILVNPTRKGYIRNEALASIQTPQPRPEEPASGVNPQPFLPNDRNMTAPSAGGTTYNGMMQSLDRTEARIRTLERMLQDMREMVDTLEIRRLSPPQHDIRGEREEFIPIRNGNRVESTPNRNWSLNALGAYYLDSKAWLFGAALLWQPSRLKGINFELEAGYLKPDSPGADGAILLNLGVLLPLGPDNWRLTPYFAAGAGVVRWEYDLPESGRENVPAANLGVGAFLRLTDRTRLRMEFRSVFEFPDSGNRSDQRAGLGLQYEL